MAAMLERYFVTKTNSRVERNPLHNLVCKNKLASIDTMRADGRSKRIPNVSREKSVAMFKAEALRLEINLLTTWEGQTYEQA